MAKPKASDIEVKKFATHHVITQPNPLRKVLRRVGGNADPDDPVLRAVTELTRLMPYNSQNAIIARGEAVHQDQHEVAVGEQLGVRRAELGPVVLAVRVERPAGRPRVDDPAKGGLDPIGRLLEHCQEELALGAEHAHDVGLGHPGLAGHGVGAGAGVTGARERLGRRGEHLLAALVGGHPGGRGSGRRRFSDGHG